MKADTVKIILAAIGIAVIIGVSATAFALRTSNHASAQALTAAKSATRALCLLRHDKVVSIRTTVQFLKDHPAGIPGVPNSLLRQGLAQTRAEVEALKDVKCS